VVVKSLVVVTTVIAGIVWAAVGVVAIGDPEQARPPICTSTGHVPGLTVGQAANARTIAAVADSRGGRRAAVIAVMTALAESDLRVLTNPAVQDVSAAPAEGVGYDHDSVGLFQQRAGWGTAAARMDPVSSTNLFLDALLDTGDWHTLPPWVAAQHVQRSAFDGTPNHDNQWSSVFGGNYLAQLDRAVRIVDAIRVASSADACEGPDIASPVNAASGRHGLPSGYSIPPGTPTAARVAVTFALAQLGKPYLWGGSGPDRFDCSGLTQRAWAAAGRTIGRTTWDQMRDGSPTAVAELHPGDLVLIPGSAGSLASPTHMGMYLGNGLVVHAPRSGDVVKVTPFDAFISGGISALRHIA
jgi:cell wall-associated NlpC family hydrolase